MTQSTENMSKTKDRDVTQPEPQPTLRVPCEVYSRIVGYLRPLQNWHEGKRQEFGERQTFRIADADVAETASR